MKEKKKGREGDNNEKYRVIEERNKEPSSREQAQKLLAK